MSEIGSQAATRHVSVPEAAHHVPAPGAARRAPAPEADGPRAAAEAWDLVTVPVRQGLEAVDILRRAAAPAVGPVVHDGTCDTLGFLVPPGTAAAWDLPGSACTRTSGRGLRLPELPELPEPAGDAPRPAGWLLPPGDTDPVTDPAVLREALGEAARLIEAADGCH
ncbi:hypothetical protein GCM10010275_24290 [Streptomyces litmocidini]|uniref:hypothetical protein n=1 Tax=Streptomyces litmocidini TaxID=67318 RepID=UPI00167CBA21|nr:hypothetical protein [Streptomyces litmocidini]GGU87465.1 hypothetical protein GCM10010275_24290 [Streptomyces litmocidini]